jgi:hypothetical protein
MAHKNFTGKRRNLLVVILLFSFGISNFAHAADWFKASTPQAVAVSPAEMSQDIALAVLQVPEFAFIQRESQKSGIKAYLFGGTAASFAHYVHWDTMRAKGDSRILTNRFSYEMVDIYNESQDLDIVLDASPEECAKMEALLKEKFPYKLPDGRSAWEVRSLKQSTGPKPALLGSFDMENQHTDSNSTSLVELTIGAKDVVKDLKAWNDSNPPFLKDLVTGKIHYYYSNSHNQTDMAKGGKNPPIISVVRFLVKALQFDLEIPAEDISTIKKIADSFNASSADDFIKHKINALTLKMMQNSMDVERSIALLNTLGLRAKLIAVVGATSEAGVLLNKEPLPTLPLGKGFGKTAKELGLDLVSHETRDAAGYYSITNSIVGKPNVFISRQNAQGEAAVYGNGLYVGVGTTGVYGGVPIKFRLNPNAKEGSDFKYVREHQYLVILNKAAISLVPDQVNGNLMDLLRMYESIGDQRSIGLREKIWKKLTSKMSTASEEEFVPFRKHILDMLEKNNRYGQWLLDFCGKSPKCAAGEIKDYVTAVAAKKAEETARKARAAEAHKMFMTIQNTDNRPDLAEAVSLVVSHRSGVSELLKVQSYLKGNDRKSQLVVLKAALQAHPDSRDISEILFKDLDLKNFNELADVVTQTGNAKLIATYLKENVHLQVTFLEDLVAKNDNNVGKILELIGFNNRPDLLDVILKIIPSKLYSQNSGLVFGFAKANDAFSQFLIAQEVTKFDPAGMTSLLHNYIPLANRPDLLPTLTTFARQARLTDSWDYNILGNYLNGNTPQAQGQILQVLQTREAKDLGRVLVRMDNMTNRPDLLPAILTLIKGESFEDDLAERVLKKYIDGNPTAKAQIQAAVNARNDQQKDFKPTLPANAKVLKAFLDHHKLNQSADDPKIRAQVASSLNGTDSADFLLTMLNDEVSYKGNSVEVITAILKSLQSSADAGSLPLLDKAYSQFTAAISAPPTKKGLLGRISGLISNAKPQDYQSVQTLWKQTEKIIQANVIILPWQYEQMMAAPKTCTKIFN